MKKDAEEPERQVVESGIAKELAKHPIIRKSHRRQRSEAGWRDFPAHASGGTPAPGPQVPANHREDSGVDHGQGVDHAHAHPGRKNVKAFPGVQGRPTRKRKVNLAALRSVQGSAPPPRLRQRPPVGPDLIQVRRPAVQREEGQEVVGEDGSPHGQEGEGGRVGQVFQGLRQLVSAIGQQSQRLLRQLFRPHPYQLVVNSNLPVSCIMVWLCLLIVLWWSPPGVRSEIVADPGESKYITSVSPPANVTQAPVMDEHTINDELQEKLKDLVSNITGEPFYPFALLGPTADYNSLWPGHPIVRLNKEKGCNQRQHGPITANGTINGFRYIYGKVAIPELPEENELPPSIYSTLRLTIDRMKASDYQLSWFPGWKPMGAWKKRPTLHPFQESVIYTSNLCPEPKLSKWFSPREYQTQLFQPTTSPAPAANLAKRGHRKLPEPDQVNRQTWSPFPASAVKPFPDQEEEDEFDVTEEAEKDDDDPELLPNVLTLDQKRFRAFDCSAPLNISAVTVQEHNLECDADLTTKLEEKKSYLLLQRASRLPLRVRQIQANYNRHVAMCGYNGHIEILFRESQYLWQYPLARWQLDQLWATGRFQRPSSSRTEMKYVKKNINTHADITPGGNWPDIICEKGKHCRFDYQKYGVTVNYWSGGVYCQGVTVPAEELFHAHSDAGDLSSGMITYYLDIHMTERDAFFTMEAGNKTTIMVDHNKEILPPECTLDSGFCQTEEAYYLWDPPTAIDKCPLFMVRKTDGIDLHLDGDRRVTYLSHDSSMVRLEKAGPAISLCDSIVQPTVVNSLLLTEDLDHKIFRRPLHPSEASPYLYSSIGDFYIYEKTQDDIERAVLGLQQHQCQHNRALKHQQIAQRAAQQSALTDGETAHLQGAQFFTARGDAGYTYNCRPVIVSAVEPDGKCYDALPVQMIREDEDLYRQIHRLGSNVTMPAFFLESSTHRLSPTAAPVRCVDALAPLYRNVDGRWVAATSTGLHLSVPPKDLGKVVTKFYEYSRGVMTNPGNGMYDQEFQKDVADYFYMKNAFVSVMNRMVETARDHSGGQWPTPYQPFSLSYYYADAPSEDALRVIDGLRWAWGPLATWSNLCTAILIMVTTWTVFSYLVGVVARCCSIPATPSPFFHMFAALFPGAADFLQRGFYRPNAPHGPCTEIIRATCAGRELRTPDGSVENVQTYNFHQARTRVRNQRERREFLITSGREMKTFQAQEDRSAKRDSLTSEDEMRAEHHENRRNALIRFYRRMLAAQGSGRRSTYPQAELDGMKQTESETKTPIVKSKKNLPLDRNAQMDDILEEEEALVDAEADLDEPTAGVRPRNHSN